MVVSTSNAFFKQLLPPPPSSPPCFRPHRHKRILTTTTTNSYAAPRPNQQPGVEAPCEPGFGGTPLPERRPSRPPRRPSGSSVPPPRRRNSAPTPRAVVAAGDGFGASGPGGKGGFTPRADGEKTASKEFSTKVNVRGRGGRAPPAAAGTPRERGQGQGGHQAPRT